MTPNCNSEWSFASNICEVSENSRNREDNHMLQVQSVDVDYVIGPTKAFSDYEFQPAPIMDSFETALGSCNPLPDGKTRGCIVHLKGLTLSKSGSIESFFVPALVEYLRRLEAGVICWDGDPPNFVSMCLNEDDENPTFASVIVAALEAIPELVAVGFAVDVLTPGLWSVQTAQCEWSSVAARFPGRIRLVCVPKRALQGRPFSQLGISAVEALGAYALAATQAQTVVSLGLAGNVKAEFVRLCLEQSKRPLANVDVQNWYVFPATRYLVQNESESEVEVQACELEGRKIVVPEVWTKATGLMRPVDLTGLARAQDRSGSGSKKDSCVVS